MGAERRFRQVIRTSPGGTLVLGNVLISRFSVESVEIGLENVAGPNGYGVNWAHSCSFQREVGE